MAEPPTRPEQQILPLPKEGFASSPSKTSALKNLGWSGDLEHVTHPFVEGLSKEEVWKLIRRMGKVTFHVKRAQKISSDELDLVAVPEQDFSPNKMRSQLERLYMGAILGGLACVKHVSRIRSWREKTRTAAFCFIYFTAWAFDYLPSVVLLLPVPLILSAQARRLLFPPAPLAVVGSLSGGVTKPNSGILGSPDSATGAPEHLQGEAVENEASNFVTALAAIAVNIMSGKDPQGEPNTEDQELKAPMKANPDELATIVASAKDKAEGVDRPSQDKTKVPMETIMWSKVPPVMHGLTTICDLWDKFDNLLDPKPSFHASSQCQQLVGVIVAMVSISIFVGRDLIFRAATFAVGVGLFGDPALKAFFHWLDKRYPDWYAVANINNNILKGVPTHPQLALALLRLSEAKNAPIPPPPRIEGDPPKQPLALTDDIIDAAGDDPPLGATDLELIDAASPDEDLLEEAGGDDTEVSKSNSKEPHKALRFIKGVTKAGVKTAISIDKVRAKAGNEGAKNREGVVPRNDKDAISGPVEFNARYAGHKGYLYLNTDLDADTVALVFNHESALKDHGGSVVRHADLKPVWSIPVYSIVELKKHSGYGFKSKMAAGWALDKELKDSLGITDNFGESRAVTAISGRDALFNRLISCGGQKWEVW